jgi:acyl-coenzyme A thioesterase PaaI-like protein
VSRLGRRIAFLEGSLFDPVGALLATATSTAMVVAR